MIKTILGIINRYLQDNLPYFVYMKIKHCAEFMLSEDFREHCIRKKSFGRLNRNKTFYILRADEAKWGILTTYIWFINNMAWAASQGYIPIVDLQHYYMPMSQDKENAYKENAWDYYFKQPYPEYSLEEVYRSKRVILGWKNGSFPSYEPYNKNLAQELLSQSDIRKYFPIVKKYMDFQPHIWERAREFWCDNVEDGKKVLAVSMRASFLWGEMLGYSLYRNHPKQKTLSECLDIAMQLMIEWKCDYIFVSVEDREWSNAFREKFGSQCLGLERQLLHFFRNGEPVPREEGEYRNQEFVNIGRKKKAEDYLTETCIVSMCNCLAAWWGSVATIALLHNGGQYEHTRVFLDGFIKE